MSNWTRKNFSEIESSSPEGSPVEARFARSAIESEELGVSRFTYGPGSRGPFGHRHRVQEEAYVVVSGSGRAKLDDEVIELAEWDVLRVAPEVVRAFEAGPEGLDLICIGGNKPPEGDGEKVDGFWE